MNDILIKSRCLISVKNGRYYWKNTPQILLMFVDNSVDHYNIFKLQYFV